MTRFENDGFLSYKDKSNKFAPVIEADYEMEEDDMAVARKPHKSKISKVEEEEKDDDMYSRESKVDDKESDSSAERLKEVIEGELKEVFYDANDFMPPGMVVTSPHYSHRSSVRLQS